MRPFDPRLMKYAKDTRVYIAFLVVLGLIMTALVGAQIFLIAGIAAPVFYDEATLSEVRYLIVALAAVMLARVVVQYVQGAYGHRSAINVIADLRTKVLRHAGDLGDRWLSEGHTSNVVTLVIRGLDDLEDYFVQFLPQLFLCFSATPLMIFAVFLLDPLSAIMIVLCIPLIPLFMILIGKMTSKYSSDRLEAMQKLGTQLLDLLSGLATLKGLGREKGPQARVKSLGDTFAEKTMQTLYVAFLSGAALEFLTTLTTALVAVEVGLRMVNGDLLLFEGLAIIMLTPEALKPLREVGTQFHASANGVAAAQKAFEILDTPITGSTGGVAVPDMGTATIEFSDVSVYSPRRATVAPAHLNARIAPGAVAVLRGASGSGKSTTVQALLGFIEPSEGDIRIGGTSLAEIDREQWWSNITWVPQRPVLVPGSVAENLLNENNGLSIDSPEVIRAADLTGFASVVNSLPQGWETRIGQGGRGLSVGQRQRLALTRAILSSRRIVILDEPSAHLDAVSEEFVANVVRTLKADGRTVIVIAHRSALANIADTVIDVVAESRDLSAEVDAYSIAKAAHEAAKAVETRDVDYALPSSWTHRSAAQEGNRE